MNSNDPSKFETDAFKHLPLINKLENADTKKLVDDANQMLLNKMKETENLLKRLGASETLGFDVKQITVDLPKLDFDNQSAMDILKQTEEAFQKMLENLKQSD